MKRKNLLMSLTLAGALSALGSQAHATSWMDFDDESPAVPTLSTDSANPTVLNQVTVVCPARGFLVATGTATAFLRNVEGGKSTGFVVFTISPTGSAQNETARTIALENLGPDTYANIPASLQRIDACNAGETRTYYLVAHGGGGPAEIQFTTEGRSRLVVEFFDTRI
jgi:hypothetical protein